MHVKRILTDNGRKINRKFLRPILRPMRLEQMQI
jgi:hypothetical protein